MKKIKIRKSVVAQHYCRIEFRDKWFYQIIIIGCIGSILVGVGLHPIFGLMSGLMLMLFALTWFKKLKSIQKRLNLLERWQVSKDDLEQLKITLPSLMGNQEYWIVEGFKDYLAMHILEKEHFAMPSYAVDQLWHILLRDSLSYRELCLQILGRELRHIEYDGDNQVTEKSKQQAYFKAWCLSCKINMLDPQYTSVLPRLFAVDYELGLKQDAAMHLKTSLVGLKQYRLDNNSSSCGGSSSCSSCGGD